MAGIDLEPNNPSERIVNCTIRNCRFWKNDGGGVMIAVGAAFKFYSGTDVNRAPSWMVRAHLEFVHRIYCDWDEQWCKDNPDNNTYDGYFAALFDENYHRHPEYQRAGGDWLNWQVPGTEYHIPIFQSGFGDGTYPVYWGIDENGEICQLVIQFIDIQLEYGTDEN